MIRQTLEATKAATFCIELPGKSNKGILPTGTGFFVSEDGWFLTAAHVVQNESREVRSDVEEGWITKEQRFGEEGFGPPVLCQWPKLDFLDLDLECDVALLKLDFQRNAKKDWLTKHQGFPFIQLSARFLSEGEPVYAFGYPLSRGETHQVGAVTHGFTWLVPRVTSAIVASLLESDAPVMTAAPPKNYVLDKALNYGNSGGPIIATETGHVHALCSRFQPVVIPQPHLKNPQGQPLGIFIPSLYGVVVNLSVPPLLQAFRERGIPIAED